MFRLISITLFLVAAFCADAQALYIKIQNEYKGEVGEFVKVPIETDCTSIKWISLDKGLYLFPVDLLKDTKTAVVNAVQPGKYRLLVYGALNGEASDPVITTVTIEGGQPGPGPQPNPVVSIFQDVYSSETDPDKAVMVEKLSSFYRTFVRGLMEGDNYQTWGQLYDTMSAAAKNQGINGRIQKIQQAIQLELQKTLPQFRNEQFDTIYSRQKAISAFSNIANQLDYVRK